MSEELLHEQTQTEAAVTMADLEEHFDDANPWNRSKILYGKRHDPACKSRRNRATAEPLL